MRVVPRQANRNIKGGLRGRATVGRRTRLVKNEGPCFRPHGKRGGPQTINQNKEEQTTTKAKMKMKVKRWRSLLYLVSAHTTEQRGGKKDTHTTEKERKEKKGEPLGENTGW